MSTLILKCASSYNYYSARNELINNKMVGLDCPRCSNTGAWDHETLCSYAKEFRKKFIVALLKDLVTKKLLIVECKDIFDMIEDILVYLEKGNGEVCVTNQYMIGMHYLFRGFSAKV